jgi:Matrixin
MMQRFRLLVTPTNTFRNAFALSLALVIVALVIVRASRGQLGGLRALDTSDAVTYFIADGNSRAGYRSGDRELAVWALQAWQRTVGKNLRFQSASESSAIIRLYWSEPNDGTYGEMRPLLVGGRHGAVVFIQPDVESLGPEIAPRARTDALLRDSIVYLTCLHELGHALGLDHTSNFSDIMYYFGYGGDIVEYFNRYRSQVQSRKDIANVSGLSDSDMKRIRVLYGRE